MLISLFQHVWPYRRQEDNFPFLAVEQAGIWRWKDPLSLGRSEDLDSFPYCAVSGPLFLLVLEWLFRFHVVLMCEASCIANIIIMERWGQLWLESLTQSSLRTFQCHSWTCALPSFLIPTTSALLRSFFKIKIILPLVIVGILCSFPGAVGADFHHTSSYLHITHWKLTTNPQMNGARYRMVESQMT